MDIDNLVHMANRIAEFFEAMPDQAEAREGVAQHLQRYASAAQAVRRAPGALEGQPPGMRRDQLVDRLRPP
jgi:hypothetical protein